MSKLRYIAIGLLIGLLADPTQPLLIGQPTVTQTYGLTLERDDFPPATAGQTTFQTSVSTRSSFALVFLNGLLQRPGADYTASGNMTITYPDNRIAAGDLVTLLFYR